MIASIELDAPEDVPVAPAAAVIRLSSIGKTVWILAAIVVLLGALRDIYIYEYGEFTFLKELRQFDLDDEANVPSWFSSILLFLIAFVSLVFSTTFRDADAIMKWSWRGLFLVFAILSMEEVAGFHEALMVPLRMVLGTSGIFYYAWVVPAIILVAVFALVYIPFLLRLPRRYAFLFIIAGAIYVAGALGFEMVGGVIATDAGEQVYYYGISTFFEETLEIVGLAIFFNAALELFALQSGVLRVVAD